MPRRFRSVSSSGLAWLLVLLLLHVVDVRAAEFDATALSKLRPAMQAFVDGKQVAGAVAVIGNAKGIAVIEAVGQQSLDPAQPMTRDSLFRIASMTKPITAMAIMQLADEGKLSVEDPVEKHLPEFRGQMLVAARDGDKLTLTKPPRPITLRDLLTHTSGLPAFPVGLADIYSRRDHTLAEMTLAMSQRPLDFEPGSKWAYCNPGIDTLGRVVEVASGKSFEAYLADRVLGPLRMKDTTFYPSAEQSKRLARLYQVKEGQLIDAGFTLLGATDRAKHPIPAGGLYSTAEDLARLYQALLQGGQLDGARILSLPALATMTKVQTGELACGFTPGMGFGFGFAVVRKPEGVTAMLSPGTYGHGGAFGTQGWIDPQRGYFVVLLIARVGLPNGDASEIRKSLQDVAIGALKK